MLSMLRSRIDEPHSILVRYTGKNACDEKRATLRHDAKIDEKATAEDLSQCCPWRLSDPDASSTPIC